MTIKKCLEIHPECGILNFSTPQSPPPSYAPLSHSSHERTHGRHRRFFLDTEFLCPAFRETARGVNRGVLRTGKSITKLAEQLKPFPRGLGVSLLMKWLRGADVSCFKTSPVLNLNPCSGSRIRPGALRCIEVDLKVNTKNVPTMRASKQLRHVLGIHKVSMTRDV